MNNRLTHALNGESADQVPFLPAIYEHKGWFVGETPSAVARDAHLLTTALLAEYERVQPDALIVGIDVYNIEAEAIGCSVNYYEGNDTSVPAIGSKGSVFQGTEGVTSLRMPDPQKDGRMPLNLEAARNIVKLIGGEIPIRGAVSGPFSLAAHLAGPGHFFLLTMTQPDLARDLLKFASEVIKQYGKAFIELGCGVIVFDSHASPDLFSPQMYRELVLPPTQGVIRYFHELGLQHVPLIIGGNTTRILDAYLETGANNILCDTKADVKEFLEKCATARRAFRRNIDSSDFLEVNSDEVFHRALNSLEESGGYPGFILGSAVLPYGTPLSHLTAMREAIQGPRNGFPPSEPPSGDSSTVSLNEQEDETMKELQDLALSVEQGKVQTVCGLTQQLIDSGVSPQRILNDGLIAGMAVVGEKMRNGEMYLPEVLQSASAMHGSLKILKPHLVREGTQSRGKIMVGTVKGDMHDIGKNLVSIMLQGAGFDVVDVGLNVPPQKFVEAITAHQPAILGLSAMLTTTMLNMKTTIEAINAAGLRSKVKVIIGGAPVSQKFADEIGADGYARDAVLAVDKVKQLLGATT